MDAEPSSNPIRVGVLGGTGVAGTPVVGELRRRGHHVRVLARGAEGLGKVDLADPATLAPGLADLEVLVDTLNPRTQKPSDARELLVDQLAVALTIAHEAGVRHVVSLGIVGADRAQRAGYMRVKVEQEAMVRAAPVPSTIVRATQFHELVAMVGAQMSRLGRLWVVEAPLQPVDPREVAVVIADAVEAQDGVDRELAGPKVEQITGLARAYLAARDPRRKVFRIPALGAFKPIAAGALVEPSAPRGTIDFAQWLTETA